MGRKAQQRRARKAAASPARPVQPEQPVEQPVEQPAARDSELEREDCPVCGELYEEEGSADGHWWRTCLECFDPDADGADQYGPLARPVQWCTRHGEVTRAWL